MKAWVINKKRWKMMMELVRIAIKSNQEHYGFNAMNAKNGIILSVLTWLKNKCQARQRSIIAQIAQKVSL